MPRFTLSISRSLCHLAFATSTIASFALANPVQAEDHDGDVPIVEYRQTVMEIIGSNMGAIGDILKNRLVLPGHVAVHAGQIAQSSQLVAAAFKQNVASNATDAKPEIWRDWAKFDSAIADLERAARELETVTAKGDAAQIGSAVKALGKSCGGCHKQFRKPKEESFKNAMHNHAGK